MTKEKVSEEVITEKESIETVPTLAPGSTLAATADSAKQEKAAEAKPAEAAENTLKKEKKPATFEKRIPSRNE